jgi:hypothetical protein
MPTSHYAQISLIMEIIVRLWPRRILDVGAGWGKYGVLCREYLGREVRIDAVEGWEPYIGPLHRAVYDRIVIGDAREVLAGLTERYDLVLMADVFEHLPRRDGEAVLAECARLADAVLISMPATWTPQEPFEGNELEVHRAYYGWRELRRMGFQVWCGGGKLVALRASRPLALRRRLMSWAFDALAPLWLRDWKVAVRRRMLGRPAPQPPLD